MCQIGVLGTVGEVGQGIRRVPVHRPVDRLGVRVDEQLGGIEAVAMRRVVGAVDPVAVPVARPDARHVDVVLEARLVIDVDPLLGAVLVKQAQLDAVAVLREHREVRAGAVPRRALRERPAGPQSGQIDHRRPAYPTWRTAISGAPERRLPTGTPLAIEETQVVLHGEGGIRTPDGLDSPYRFSRPVRRGCRASVVCRDSSIPAGAVGKSMGKSGSPGARLQYTGRVRHRSPLGADLTVSCGRRGAARPRGPP